MATSAVQGIAAGVFYASLFLFGVPASGSSHMAIGQLAAVVLLFATLVFLRLDFNRFIYKVAFFVRSCGVLAGCDGARLPQLGFRALVAGFCYLDLVLWSLAPAS